MMQIDFQTGGSGQDRTPDLRGDLGGGFREKFVGTLCVHPESADVAEQGRQIGAGDRQDAFHILFALGGAGHADKTEDAPGGIVGAVEVAQIVLRRDVDRAFGAPDLKATERNEAAFQLARQRSLEFGAVRPFQNDLAVFAEDDL